MVFIIEREIDNCIEVGVPMANSTHTKVIHDCKLIRIGDMYKIVKINDTEERGIYEFHYTLAVIYRKYLL